MDRETFDEIRSEFRQALPALAAGLPDRTDLMVSHQLNIDWSSRKRRILASEIKQAVVEVYGIYPVELTAKFKSDPISLEARQVAAFLLVFDAELSREDAGLALSRDQSTITHSVKKIRSRLDEPEIKHRIARIRRLLGVAER